MTAAERRAAKALNRRFRADAKALFLAFTESEPDADARSDEIARAYARYERDLRDALRLLKRAGATRRDQARVKLLIAAVDNLGRGYGAPEGEGLAAIRRAERALSAWRDARR